MNTNDFSKRARRTDAARHVSTSVKMLAACIALAGLMLPMTALAQATVTVTNTADDANTGSLRWAITNVSDGSTITFDASLAGDTVTLASLLTITKSVTIEGNGITLSGNNACKIMNIDATGKTVTIRRVHFKDGKDTDTGGAIRISDGTLNLQSCIFSGNRATSGYSYGGALCNNGILNVQGCTFYNNSTPNLGGAIYNSAGTSTLAGNLFYGNTAFDGAVIYSNGGTVTSGGYNVYDGASANFTFSGTGDTQITTLAFDSDIRPTGTAANIVAAGLPDFPAYFFNGETRTFLNGTAGAMKYVPDVTTGITGDCNWELTGVAPNYILTISGTGAMADYESSFGMPWADCRFDIKTLEIQSGVTTIGNIAFFVCTGLTSVTIGNSVTTIGYQAFSGCSSLTAIYSLNPTPPDLEYYVFNGVNITNCTLYVPAGSEELYAVADQWKDFSRMEVTGVTVQVELRNSSNNLVTSPEARVLFYRTDAGEVEAYAAEKVAAGSYQASLPAGSYIVAAENATGYLTTYYATPLGVTRWHDAETLTIDSESTITIHMAAVPQDIETGTVTIDGYVYEDGTQKARVARNASVGIYYSKKSKPASKRFEPDPEEWTLIRTVTPDENAYYIVQNLPPGRYMIVADIPGYELTGGYTVEAEEGEALHDNNFFVNDYAQVITISDNPTSAPSQENVTFSVYPNPAKGETQVSGAAGCTLTVFTATGATVHSRKITAQNELVSLKGLPSGLYFFRITDKNGKKQTIKIVNRE